MVSRTPGCPFRLTRDLHVCSIKSEMLAASPEAQQCSVVSPGVPAGGCILLVLSPPGSQGRCLWDAAGS